MFKRGCGSCNECLSICPGFGIDAEFATGSGGSSLAEMEFGSALEIWEGHAADPEIRYCASSGGILSALALYCLEQESMFFVLHTAGDPDRPWLNVTVQSRTRAELLGRAGSRYAPASPCEGLADIGSSEGPCVFIGKPCDTAAAMMLGKRRPEIGRRLGLVLACFCAGTPSTQGTLDLFQEMGVPPEQVKRLRYRGNGWPGGFEVVRGNGFRPDFVPYDKAWGALTHYVPLRCRLCPDGLGQIADISCGDAWEHYQLNPNDPGRSLVIVRTAKGQDILRRAIAAKYVELTRVEAGNVFAAQPQLLSRRRELMGRLLGMRLLLRPTPAFKHFSLLRSWMSLPGKKKLRTVAGSVVRGVGHGLWRRQPVSQQARTPEQPVA